MRPTSPRSPMAVRSSSSPPAARRPPCSRWEPNGGGARHRPVAKASANPFRARRLHRRWAARRLRRQRHLRTQRARSGCVLATAVASNSTCAAPNALTAAQCSSVSARHSQPRRRQRVRQWRRKSRRGWPSRQRSLRVPSSSLRRRPRPPSPPWMPLRCLRACQCRPRRSCPRPWRVLLQLPSPAPPARQPRGRRQYPPPSPSSPPRRAQSSDGSISCARCSPTYLLACAVRQTLAPMPMRSRSSPRWRRAADAQ
mmetsp:Transcript_49012/g.127941  ORF Transcript_49012/g.127941 Transcript_49012/m.127941 type:complete len:255 (-) Transcript_49012:284-1048(-)